MKILISYRAIPQSPGWSTGDMLARAFESLGHEVFRYAKVYASSRWLEDPRHLLDREYDLYIQMECGDGDVFYSVLKDVKVIKKVSWWFDIALYPERWQRETQYIGSQINFVANPDFDGIYLPYAADVGLHFRNVPKINKFAFIGSDRKERQDLAKELGIELKIGFYRDQYIDYLGLSQYTICDLAGGGTNLIPMKPFECAMAGSIPIVPFQYNFGRTNIACIEYSSVKELKDICQNIHKFDISRHEVQDIAIEQHSYQNRAQKILEVCGFAKTN